MSRQVRPVSSLFFLGVTCCGGQPPEAEPARAEGEAPKAPIGATLDAFSFAGSTDQDLSWNAREGLRLGSDPGHAPAALVVHVFQPDCLACRNEARELERFQSTRDAMVVRVVGIAHKQDLPAVRGFAQAVDCTYPLATATGTDWATRWGRGDPTYIVDRSGRVAYAQVGFHPSDPELWSKVAEDLAAGRSPRATHPEREVLKDGERFPAVTLPDLETGKPMTLATNEHGRLYFERDGERKPWRAAIGFFSRY